MFCSALFYNLIKNKRYVVSKRLNYEILMEEGGGGKGRGGCHKSFCMLLVINAY